MRHQVFVIGYSILLRASVSSVVNPQGCRADSRNVIRSVSYSVHPLRLRREEQQHRQHDEMERMTLRESARCPGVDGVDTGAEERHGGTFPTGSLLVPKLQLGNTFATEGFPNWSLGTRRN